MTVGQLIECLVGKVSAIRGHETDGTPFNDIDVEAIKNELESLGFDRNGMEEMYNGMTGRKMNTHIFIGPTYYQRLKHMVGDKMHCLTMDHEVLTADGWKFFENITMEDMISTLDDGELRYEHPIELLHYPDFAGTLYHVHNDEIDLLVTYNHRMFVNRGNGFELIEVSHLRGYDGIEYANMNNGSNVNSITFNHKSGKTDIYYDKQPVFCLQVPSEVFYVRRNGKCTWTGNSRARGPMTLLTRQPLEGRSRDGGLRFGKLYAKVISKEWLVCNVQAT